VACFSLVVIMEKISMPIRNELLLQLCERVPAEWMLATYLDVILQSWIADHPICPECKAADDGETCNCKTSELL